MDVSQGLWAALIIGILGLIVLDFVTVSRKPHDVMFKEAALWSLFYIGIAIAFGVWVWTSYGSTFGTEYFAAYLVEKSLSVDNLFVFIIILTQFAVPSIYHQRVLLFGVLLALIFRAIFIALGAAALEAFAFTFVIFGAILIYTGYGLFKHWDEDPDPSENVMVRNIRKVIPFTDEYHGTKLTIKEAGKRYGTPMLLVMIAIGATLKGLLDKLVYLSLGLSAILVFIGMKLILLYGHEQNEAIPKIPTSISLVVIASILTIATVASFIKVRKDPTARAHAGRITDAPKDTDN